MRRNKHADYLEGVRYLAELSPSEQREYANALGIEALLNLKRGPIPDEELVMLESREY